MELLKWSMQRVELTAIITELMDARLSKSATMTTAIKWKAVLACMANMRMITSMMRMES